MRLRTTLFGLLVVVAIVLSGTVYAGFALHKAEIVESERRSLNATADGLAGTLDTRIEEKQTMVSLAAADPTVVPGATDWRSEMLVERFIDGTDFDGASIVDENGIMIAISVDNLSNQRERELVGRNFSQRAYVRHGLAGTSYIGTSVAAESGNHVMPISVPIERRGRVVGVFTGTLHLEDTSVFSDLRANLEPGQTISITDDGSTLYDSGPTPDNALVASAPALETGWQVTVRQDRDRLQNALLVATVTQFGAVAVAILAVAVLGVWISRSTLGNIQALIAGLNRLEAGEYDSTLDVGPTDEWARIESQFGSLAETLDQRESQLRVLNRVLRHNLRNDMSVVIAHAETLLQDGEADREKVETIRRTAYNLVQTSSHARTIYEDLLRDGPAARHPVDVVEVVESDVETLREDFPRSRIETDLPAEAWVMDGDTVPVVVDELARNALVHNDLPAGERELTVTVDPGPKAVSLHVSDNGPGFPTVEAELLTGDREETAIHHGSGLGLWVVNWLVTRLGGDVALDSSADRGSTVTVTFPVSEADAAAGEEGT